MAVEAVTTCPECGGRIEDDPRHGENVCTECGLVVESDLLDLGPDWRSFNQEQHDKRAHASLAGTNLRHDRGLGSKMGRTTDGMGNYLDSSDKIRASRMRRWNTRHTMQSSDRDIMTGMNEIRRMGSVLGVPEETMETAGMLFRRARDEDVLRGRSIEGVATASLYAACRIHRQPKSFDELMDVSRIDKRRRVMSDYREISKVLKLKIPLSTPMDFIDRIVSELNGTDRLRRRSFELAEKAFEMAEFSGKSPQTIAAAAVYTADMAGYQHFSQSAVADAADVSALSIRTIYHLMENVLEAV